jgi:hypothetical protein
VTAFWIDDDRSISAASTWASRGDELSGIQLDLERDLGSLALSTEHSPVLWHLAAASTELWITTSFVRLVVDRVRTADRAAPAFGAVDVARLRERAGRGVQQSLVGACAPSWAAFSFSSVSGDVGETGDAEVRSPYLVTGADDAEVGRALVVRALTDTASTARIRPDEFELVQFADGRYLVVLPGVTDLSRPDLGLSAEHRSVRDVDQFAYPSWRSTSVDDNRYARMVWDALVDAGVPPGASLMIVGHSYGADTALDLAADAGFNGPGGFDVTHVVAAGYHSRPQLPDVGRSTEVLVLQNHRDAAVIVESAADDHLAVSVDERRAAIDRLRHLDPLGAWAHVGRALGHDAGVVADVVGHAVDHVGGVVRIAVGAVSADARLVDDGLADVVFLEPTVDRVGDRQVVDVFEGRGVGAGHHQDNYVGHVAAVADPLVTAFFASVARAGFGGVGVARAIDASVP